MNAVILAKSKMRIEELRSQKESDADKQVTRIFSGEN